MKSLWIRYWKVTAATLMALLLCFAGGFALSSKRGQQEEQAYEKGMAFFQSLKDYHRRMERARWSLQTDPQGSWFQEYVSTQGKGIAPSNLSPLGGLSDSLFALAQASHVQIWNLGKAYQEGDLDLSAVLERTAQYCQVEEQVTGYLDAHLHSKGGMPPASVEQVVLVGRNLMDASSPGNASENPFYDLRAMLQQLIPADLLTAYQ